MSADVRMRGGSTVPEEQEWPRGGVQSVPVCPVCDSREREVLYEGLTDQIFFCAPGRWTLYLCRSCGSAYLDPCPTPETIHLAYRTYFTHDSQPRRSIFQLGLAMRLRRRLANGYRNWRFGGHFVPASAIGTVIFLALPGLRRRLDRQMRHLPRLHCDARVLDLGFGGGEFLHLIRDGGWHAAGADFDLVAVAAARARGLHVREGGIEVFADQLGSFDVVTLSHVIEHVHDPRTVLKAAYHLLKPGGTFWIETPNLAGPGHARFGRYWLGLDPPRHLVLFPRRTLMGLVAAAGFTDIIDLPYVPVIHDRFRASLAVERGISFDSASVCLSEDDIALAARCERLARWDPDGRDDISLICRKGDD